MDKRVVAMAADAKVNPPREDPHFANKSCIEEAVEQLEVVANSMESLDAAIDRKMLQLCAPAAETAVHSSEEEALHAGLWLEIMDKDLGEVKLTLACRVTQLNCKGQKWLRGC